MNDDQNLTDEAWLEKLHEASTYSREQLKEVFAIFQSNRLATESWVRANTRLGINQLVVIRILREAANILPRKK